MLTVTAEAADAVKKLVEDSDVPESGGLRIYAAPVNGSEATLQLNIVAEPEAADHVVGTEGTQVFLEQNAAQFLDDKVLHATFEDQSIRFAIETLPGTRA